MNIYCLTRHPRNASSTSGSREKLKQEKKWMYCFRYRLNCLHRRQLSRHGPKDCKEKHILKIILLARSWFGRTVHSPHLGAPVSVLVACHFWSAHQEIATYYSWMWNRRHFQDVIAVCRHSPSTFVLIITLKCRAARRGGALDGGGGVSMFTAPSRLSSNALGKILLMKVKQRQQ